MMKPRIFLLLFALALPLAAEEPLREATNGRLWLKVPPGDPPLKEVAVSKGSAMAATWEQDAAVRERLTDVLFPVSWWEWTQLELSFVPAADGTVELTLHGPWAADIGGKTPRMEVLWDELSATGTTITNGGFEEAGGNGPAAWDSIWGPYPSAGDWPLAGVEAMSGTQVAAAWNKRPLVQALQVKAGEKVTLRLHAKAATTPGFVAPKRLSGRTPAHEALARIKRGVNLGNGWEATPGQNWGVHFTTEDIDRIAAEGFDHIRVPVAWHFHLREGAAGWEIDPKLLAELEPVLRRALDKKLHVFLNWHHFHDLTNDPAANEARFIAGWEVIARHFQSWPAGLFFELLNEPCDALTTVVANPIYQKTIRAVRKSNPSRILVVSPGHWGIVGELENLRLPDEDERLVVTVHCYEPFHFTHQGANWVGFQALRGVRYPGPPETPLALPESLRENPGVRSFIERYNTLPGEQNPSSRRVIRELMDTAASWSRHFGRPVHLGEFGAHGPGNLESRSRYLRDVRDITEERKIPWTLWEWKAGFGYWDPRQEQPVFRAALFE